VVIAHRLSTIVHCNKILFIKQGRVFEEGTHDELLAKKGHYFDLASKTQKAKQN